MPALILPRRFTQQPPAGARLDTANPLLRGLAMAVSSVPGAITELLTGAVPASVSGTGSSESINGPGRVRATASTYDVLFATPASLNSPTSYSWLVRGAVTATNTYSGIFSKAWDGSNDQGFGTVNQSGSLGIQHDNSFGAAVEAVSNFSTGAVFCGVATWDGANVRWYRDGKKVATVAYSTAVTSGNGPLKVFAKRDGGDTTGFHEHTLIWANRVLSDAEAQYITRPENAYFFFKAPQRRIWVAAASGGNAASSATTDGADVLTASVRGLTSSATTDGTDTLSANVAAVITTAVTDATDVMSAGVLMVVKSLTTDGADVVSSSVVGLATSATTDGADTIVASVGSSPVTSTTTDGADTVAASVLSIVTSTTTDGTDTVTSVVGSQAITSATTDGADVVASSVLALVTSSTTDGADAVAATVLGYVTSATVDGVDTVTASINAATSAVSSATTDGADTVVTSVQTFISSVTADGADIVTISVGSTSTVSVAVTDGADVVRAFISSSVRTGVAARGFVRQLFVTGTYGESGVLLDDSGSAIADDLGEPIQQG